MKFVHIADMHFDTTFNSLGEKENLGEKRRLDQRGAFNKIINYINEHKIEYFFISGDLYEQKYIRESTIEYINNKFKEIANTKIFISPGNHDPYLKNSYYANFNWSSNVKIFRNEIEKIEFEDANIYGFGFTDFYCKESKINELVINSPEKLNVLIIHGTLDGSDKIEMLYNPLSTNMLNSKGFDYIALGHIHKNNIQENNRIIYPGSTISLGFDELGEHGMVVGEITKENKNIQFVSLDNREFVEYDIDITEINSKESLIEILNDLYIPENNLYKIILNGTRNFEIDTLEVMRYITNERILKIKNSTKLKYNLDEIKNEQNLRGFFVKNLLQKQESGEYDAKEVENAIEIGLEIL